MDDNADAKRILLAVASAPVDWRRQRARSRITWLSTIQQDLRHHHLTITKAADLAQNCPLWRIIVDIWRYAALELQARNDDDVENRNFFIPHLHLMPSLSGNLSEFHHVENWNGRATRRWKKLEDMLAVSMQYMNVTDRHTHRQTPRHGIGHAVHSITWQILLSTSKPCYHCEITPTICIWHVG